MLCYGPAVVSDRAPASHARQREASVRRMPLLHQLDQTSASLPGDAPGTRTPNLVIKSHLLCQIELARRFRFYPLRSAATCDPITARRQRISVLIRAERR